MSATSKHEIKDPIEEMKSCLKTIVEVLRELKKLGFDDEILIAYIKYKHADLNIKKIKAILETEYNFLKAAGAVKAAGVAK